MLSKNDAIKKAQAFINELTDIGLQIDNAILFGSFAKNVANENSDIDLALSSKEFNGFGFEDRKLFSNINIKNDYLDIETKTYNSDYFLSGDPFINEIKNSGIILI